MSEPSKPAGFTNPFDWLKKKANKKDERHEEQPQAQAAPPPAPAPSPPPATPPPAAQSTTAVQERTYTVRAGDTLWAIADQFYGDGRKYTKIAAANGIANPDHIDPGQELKIPE